MSRKGEQDPRRRRRRDAGVGATLRRADGTPLAASVTDLSETGCRIETEEGAVALDDTVIVRPQGIAALAGRVCWTHEKTAGIEFASALHPALVDHLTGDDPLEGTPMPERTNTSGFSDHFGRPLPTLGSKRRRG